MSRAVLLVNLGTPTAPTPRAVRRYLREFLGDRRVVPLPRALWLPLLYGVITPLRSPRVAKAYRGIWMAEGSPLAVYSRRLAESLAREAGLPVALAMRYGEPDMETAVKELLRQGVRKLTVIPLYPQYSQTTTASVFDRLAEILARLPAQPGFCFRSDYHDHPAYIEAVAGSIRDFWQRQGRPEKLLLSFHGLPEKSRRQGDPYYDQCVTSARLIAAALGLGADDWMLVFQSRFGPARWLGPYCVEVLKRLPQEGVWSVDVVCPGFAVDCLETLEEIAGTNREVFLQAGGRQYRYIPALNDSPRHLTLMRALVEENDERST
ncbi:protoporphyrin/coproporphyrin ferrochelatase [Methylomarinovum caldicuralii]|uniref:Ferrochelatase n=1 Tax=Methylomarinovum caldicuralii TaxID=438856 RepID=A0AAU9C4R3_9GAMM|nr:ferrochelatase [Methylomarinovum caldicuralii]BCX82185.1 protoporphyrin/coproporphyrin ferrochelatase [Methylomarinovum caldicuralii]